MVLKHRKLKARVMCLCVAIATGAGCGGEALSETHTPLTQISTTSTPAPKVFSDGQVSVENVSFSFNCGFIDLVETWEDAAESLQDNETKPDSIGGRTLKFRLHYADSPQAGSISVFKLAEYKEAFKLFPHYVGQRDRKLIELLDKPASLKRSGTDEPVHVRWMDAHHDFYAKSQILRFQGGRGLLMLTQIGQDAYNIINNGQLEFFFQGITDDGVYFVEIRFPARMESLPDEPNYKIYNLPEDFSDLKSQKLHRSYLARIVKEIDAAPESKLQPTLTQIRAFIEGVKVK